MKISYTWLLDYLLIDHSGTQMTLSPQQVTDMLTEIGLEVEELTHYEAIPGGLNGLVIGHVLDTWPHPNADRLKVTRVDIGHDEPSTIVCGAPNVAPGQKVVVATVGSTLYPTKGEPFTINKAKIRGEGSFGMICAADEIGLGEDHAGIMVLHEDAPVGQPAASYFKVFQDWVIEIGLTPNRSDAMSHIGVARDLVAHLNVNTPYTATLQLPKLQDIETPAATHPIHVSVEDNIACPRYAGLVFDELQIGSAPQWMTDRLEAIGVKSINNVVDITNFILHEWGQPLHAFDYQKIADHQIQVKKLPQDTSFVSLDGEERKLHEDDLMICNRDEAMCIAGVYGGLESGVTDQTETLFLESAYFDPIHIRKTALRHNLRTDAAMHFEKGIDPNLTLPALQRAADLLGRYAQATVASPLVDINPDPVEPATVVLTKHYLTTMAGEHLDDNKVTEILTSMGMHVVSSADAFTVKVPTYKTDVTRPADVMEELLRIYGYNNIQTPEVMHTAISIHAREDVYAHRERALQYLAHNGFVECYNLSFTAGYQLIKAEQAKETDAVLLNALSAELDVMRPDLLYGMLQTAARNLNHRNDDLKLVELGRQYALGEDGFEEAHQLLLLITGQTGKESWESVASPVGYYDIKRPVVHLLEHLGVSHTDAQPVTGNTFTFGQQLLHQEQLLADIGLVNPKLAKHFDIKKPVYVARVYWDTVEALAQKAKIVFQPIPRFPGIRRDLALVIDKEVSYQDLEQLAVKEGGQYLQSINLFDIYEDKKLGEGKLSYALSFTFRDDKGTLTDKPVDKVMQRLIEQYAATFQATIRQ